MSEPLLTRDRRAMCRRQSFFGGTASTRLASAAPGCTAAAGTAACVVQNMFWAGPLACVANLKTGSSSNVVVCAPGWTPESHQQPAVKPASREKVFKFGAQQQTSSPGPGHGAGAGSGPAAAVPDAGVQRISTGELWGCIRLVGHTNVNFWFVCLTAPIMCPTAAAAEERRRRMAAQLAAFETLNGSSSATAAPTLLPATLSQPAARARGGLAVAAAKRQPAGAAGQPRKTEYRSRPGHSNASATAGSFARSSSGSPAPRGSPVAWTPAGASAPKGSLKGSPLARGGSAPPAPGGGSPQRRMGTQGAAGPSPLRR